MMSVRSIRSRSVRSLVGCAVLASVAVTGVATSASARDTGKLKADRMLGVPTSMTGAAGAIRGVNGGGLAWGIDDAEVTLKASGKLEVEFSGLVFTDGPNTGKNTLPTMSVVVSCLDAANQPVNVLAGPFPVTVGTDPATDPGGDGEFEGRVRLPDDCFAPIVMITNAPGTGWFAVTGL